MTNPPRDPHHFRKEAIVDVASHPAAPEQQNDPFEPTDEKLPKMSFMTTSEALRGEMRPEEHAELEEKFRQLLLSHLELERRVAHIQYTGSFDKIKIEALNSELSKFKKTRDPRWLKLVAGYLPVGFACLLFLLEEYLRHIAK